MLFIFSIQGSSKGGSSSSSSNQAANMSNSGLAALQNMALGTAPSSKDSALNALFAQAAQADTQAFIKQQQKLLQQLPPNSPQRKQYEAILAEMKQASEYSK